jgi:hypothetical protein
MASRPVTLTPEDLAKLDEARGVICAEWESTRTALTPMQRSVLKKSIDLIHEHLDHVNDVIRYAIRMHDYSHGKLWGDKADALRGSMDRIQGDADIDADFGDEDMDINQFLAVNTPEKKGTHENLQHP